MKKSKARKATAPLTSFILWLLVGVIVVFIVYAISLPYVSSLNSIKALEDSKKIMQNIGLKINEVLPSVNSVSQLEVDLTKKELVVDSTTNQIWIELEFKAETPAVNAVIQEGSVYYQNLGGRAKVWLDFNNSGIDLNNSLQARNGFYTLILTDINKTGRTTFIEAKTK